MKALVRQLVIALALGGLMTAGPVAAQQDPLQAPGRRTAPPMPPIRIAPPPEAPGRRTAPPMPPISRAPLPRTTYRMASFGDSLAAGLLAAPGRGYAALYGRALEQTQGIHISSRNLAVRGQTTSQLATSLTTATSARQALVEADIITWNSGGNDLLAARQLYKERRCGGADNQDCLRHTLASFKHSWDVVASVMKEARASGAQRIVTMDIYNPFVREDAGADTWPHDAGSDLTALAPYWAAVNAHIAQSVAGSGIHVGQVARAFNGPEGNLDPADAGYMSRDGFHPNDRGHAVIAQEMLQ